MEIIVTQPHKRRAVLSFGKMEAPCSIGKGGIKKNKAEGDLCTPAGMWALKRVFYRGDRIKEPETGLQTFSISKIWAGQMIPMTRRATIL